MKNILVTTYPFGLVGASPVDTLNQLKKLGYKCHFNDFKRKLTSKEHVEKLRKHDPEIIIAGTERYTSTVLDNCPSLKMISRVGIGLDAIDLDECSTRGIAVENTPDAPTNAVSELTISQMLSLLRRTYVVDSEMRSGNWERFIGREISDCCVGVIGAGRIGTSVISKLQGFRPKKILYTDLDPSRRQRTLYCRPASPIWSTKTQILEECDIITIHIPMNEDNLNYLDLKDFEILKSDAVIINTSRGGIVNESALYDWLREKPSASAAIDVFEKEPYDGKLITLPNILLSPHLGSCSKTSRLQMELGAANNALNFIRGHND